MITIRRTIPVAILVIMMGMLVRGGVQAQPSTEFWTPCIEDFQPSNLTRLALYDNFKLTTNDALATDIGPEWGAKLTNKLSAEYGFDVLCEGKNPLYFNAKVGYTEGMLGKNAPALEVGIFDVGTKAHATDFNVVDLLTGKTLPDGKTRIHAGGYYGNPGALGTQNTGVMIALDHQLDKNGKWVFAADYATGKNAVGGGGLGVYYYFTKNISVLVGPEWFNDKAVNGDPKMTFECYFNF